MKTSPTHTFNFDGADVCVHLYFRKNHGQTGFPATGENWNIPFLDYYAERSYGYWGEHALIDMNGDNIADLIDFEEDNNRDIPGRMAHKSIGRYS
jgi:hypothetical protein